MSIKVLVTSISALLLTIAIPGNAQFWSGGTADLSLGGVSGNWTNAATPGNTDTAIFLATGNTTPAVTNLSAPTTFNPLNIQFNPGASSYSISSNANNIGAAVLSIGNGTSGSVVNNSSFTQTFNAVSGGLIQFQAGSQAAPATFGNVTYNINSNSSSVSSLSFTSALAGKATINIGNASNSMPATVFFNGNSDAQTCTINPQYLGSVTFNDTSNVDAATISPSVGGSVIFNTAMATSTATVLLTSSATTFSSATLNQNIALNRITSDAKSTINLNSSQLTISTPNTGDTLAGIISGSGGSLVKKGSNTLTVSNNSNSYSGNTTVASGTLAVTPLSLSSSTATVQSGATLQFYSSSGTYAGNITDNGTVEISTSPVTLSGTITGSGAISVDTGQVLTLAGLGNTYGGGTSVGGTLNTNAVNLPPGAPITTTNSSAVINFTTPAPETYSGAASGPGQLTMNGTSILQLTGPNTYSGGTTINSGVLVVSSQSLPFATSQPSATVNGGVLDFFQVVPGTYLGGISLANASTLLQTDGIAPLTLAGVVGGSGKLNVNSGYTILANTGNTYSGGTLVSGGTLQTTVATLPLSNKDILSLNGTLLFLETSNETYAGTIFAGSGTLQKQGPSTLTLTGNLAGFSGTTQVLQGILALNTTLGGSVIVDTGGVLTGTNSKILGNLIVHNGTVNPTGIATMTVNGNYRQDLTGIYMVDINGSGQSDLINVGGTAALSGTLSVFSLDGVADPTKMYQIMHANGGVSGQFFAIKSNIPNFVPVVTYTANDVFINLQPLLIVSSSTHNQLVVSQQLTSIINPTPQEQAILNRLNALSANPATINEARRAMEQMSGEQYSNTILATQLASRQFLRRLYDPLRSLLGKDIWCQDNCCTPFQNGSFSYPYLQLPDYDRDTDGQTFWASIGGGRSFLRSDSNANGFSMDSIDFSVGLQKLVYTNLTVGLAAGYQHDRLDYNIGGNGKNNIGLLGIYALYNPEAFYLLGDFVLTYNSCRINRPIDIADLHYRAQGKPQALQETLYAEVGKLFNLSWLQYQPFFGIELDSYYGCRFNESSANPLNLSVRDKTRFEAFTRLGVHLVSANPCRYLSFDVDLAWQCRLTSSKNHLSERFVDFGQGFTIFGITAPRNCLEGTANVGVELGKNCACFLELTGQRWERLSTYNVTAGFSYSW